MKPQDLLARVVEHLPIGVFAFSADGTGLVWNARAERLTGWTREHILTRGLHGLPLDAPTARRIADELLAGRPFGGRWPAAGAGGTLYFHAEPVASPEGPVLAGVLQDVEDARAGDEAFALLDALWETAPVGLAYFDTDLRYRRVNGAVLDIDGGTVEDRLGRTLEAVHGPTGAEIADGLREVLADGRTRLDVVVGGRLWHGRGPYQEWRLNEYPVRAPGGEILGVGMVVVDVTQVERTRRELAELAAEREQALTRYQSLVEATSAAVWIREADGRAEQDAPGLRALTGQTPEQHRGWGFLDAVHPADRAAARAAWGSAVAGACGVFTHTHRLRTADRGYRWFRTRAVPVCAGGRATEWVGTESDIDDEVLARQRLELLARATAAVNAALDPEEELTALADVVVPAFADVCRVYLVDTHPAGSSRGVTGRRSVTREAEGVLRSPAAESRFAFPANHPIARSVRTAAPLLVPVPVPPDLQWHGSAELERWGDDAGVNSILVAPVVTRGTAVAALLLLACGDRRTYTSEDLALVGELAARASTAVEHAVRFQQTRQVSLALQSAMLTAPPAHPGLEIEARYLPAVAELEVGGDWYDAFELPGGDLAVGVGDVAGHDLPAAAEMGQLRSMLRALAYDTDAAPSEVLRRLDRVASRLAVTHFTTLVHGRIGKAGGRTVFRWANAGHPVPILVGPDGEPRPLAGGIGVVLGVEPGLPREDREVELPPGSTLLLHTDGLVERRSDPDDRAATDLLDLVRSAAGLPLAEFCDHVVRKTPADTGDDIVVLAIRVPA